MPHPKIVVDRLRSLAQHSLGKKDRSSLGHGPANPTESMQKLGLVSEHEVMGPKAREEYGRLFNKPLSQSHVEALASLFGWHMSDIEHATGEGDVLVHPTSLEA
jgi:hypothetical protein